VLEHVTAEWHGYGILPFWTLLQWRVTPAYPVRLHRKYLSLAARGGDLRTLRQGGRPHRTVHRRLRGTDSWHTGECADPRTCAIGEKYGIAVTSIARPFEARDYDRFDLILAMDRGHLNALRARATQSQQDKLRLMRDYDSHENRGQDVPDPYYGGAEGFERMYRMLSVCCRNLLDSLNQS